MALPFLGGHFFILLMGIFKYCMNQYLTVGIMKDSKPKVKSSLTFHRQDKSKYTPFTKLALNTDETSH
jgi:hypothetical protein